MATKASLMRALQVVSALLVVSISAIALAGYWWWALLLYCMQSALHAGSQPLYATWLNMHIDQSHVRATIFSVNSQMNAIGQVFGGPAVGLVGERLGLRAAPAELGIAVAAGGTALCVATAEVDWCKDRERETWLGCLNVCRCSNPHVDCH